MGTRNLTIVYLDGEYKVAQYGQWDGYPSGQGVTCLKFAQRLGKYTGDCDAFKNAVRNCRYPGMNENGEFDGDQTTINRDICAEILPYIMEHDGADLLDDIKFAADSLFCEWAYVIDLDNNTFNVYQGFNKEPLEKNDRFYFLQSDPMYGEYYPIKLLKSYPLSNLPSIHTFVRECEAEHPVCDVDCFGCGFTSLEDVVTDAPEFSSLFGGVVK